MDKICIIRPAFWIPWFSMIVICYIFMDQPLIIYLNQVHHSHPDLVSVFNIINMLGVSTSYFLALTVIFLFSFFLLKNKIMAWWALYIMLVVSIAGFVCMILKLSCGRARPQELLGYHIYGFYFLQFDNKFWSFPSGHATTISSVAGSFYFILKRYGWLLLLIVCSVMLGRMICLDHYLSDVMAGAYIGFITSYLLFPLFNRGYHYLCIKVV